jgi:hypothetical protein
VAGYVKVIWSEVSVSHRHHDHAVPENLLQCQNVSPTHHKVAGKGISENMGTLPFGDSILACVSADLKTNFPCGGGSALC